MAFFQEVIRACEANLLKVPQQPLTDETIYLQEYNERLVKKLEAKALELEGVNKSLKASEEKYRGLVDNATAAIVSIEPTGNMSLVNRKFLEMTGYSQEEALALDLGQFLHPEGSSQALTCLEKGLAGHTLPSSCQLMIPVIILQVMNCCASLPLC